MKNVSTQQLINAMKERAGLDFDSDYPFCDGVEAELRYPSYDSEAYPEEGELYA
jgi:hypothetical protein